MIIAIWNFEKKKYEIWKEIWILEKILKFVKKNLKFGKDLEEIWKFGK